METQVSDKPCAASGLTSYTLDPSRDEILVRRANRKDARLWTRIGTSNPVIAIAADFPNRVHRVPIDFTIPPPARVCAMSTERDFYDMTTGRNLILISHSKPMARSWKDIEILHPN